MDLRIRFLSISCLAFGISACTSGSEDRLSESDLKSFATLAERHFQTPPENTENIILDRRVRVEGESLQGHWVYTQLNTGTEQKTYRQRLANFVISDDQKSIVQRTYTLADPQAYENLWEKPDVLARTSAKDYTEMFNQGCELNWTKSDAGEWDGLVDPETCIIHSKRRNKDIRIGSVSRMTQDKYQSSESGYEMDMTYLWGSKPGELITLYPVK